MEGLATEKVTIPGWIHNTHAVYHMMVDYAPVFQDLELISRYKLDFVKPELSMTMPLSDGRAVCLYDDPQKTAENFAVFSKADAEAYLEMNAHFTKLVDNFIAPATYAEAHPPMEQLANLQKTEIGREVQAIQEKTPLEIVDRWFENEHIKGLMLYAACFWGLDYDLEGLGFLVPLMIERAAKYRLLKGGSHQLSNRLSKDIYAHGGMILGSQLIKRIIIDDGRATGVELEDGTVHTATKFVASSLDPHQTFLDYVGEQHLDSGLRDPHQGLAVGHVEPQRRAPGPVRTAGLRLGQVQPRREQCLRPHPGLRLARGHDRPLGRHPRRRAPA